MTVTDDHAEGILVQRGFQPRGLLSSHESCCLCARVEHFSHLECRQSSRCVQGVQNISLTECDRVLRLVMNT